MRRFVVMASTLLMAGPAFGQSHVYTNADLGKPLARITTVTPEQLEEMAAHQFRLPPAIPNGPTFIVIGSRTPPPQSEWRGPYDPSPLDWGWQNQPAWFPSYGFAVSPPHVFQAREPAHRPAPTARRDVMSPAPPRPTRLPTPPASGVRSVRPVR